MHLFLNDYNGKGAAILEEEYESVKNNLKHILQAVDFCGICLENKCNMFHVRELMTLELPTSCSMEVMMNDLFGEMLLNNIPSKYICDHCVHNIRQTYHFINKVKTTSLILNSYISQLDSQIDEVENMLDTTETNNFENMVIVLQNLIPATNKTEEEPKVLTLFNIPNKFVEESSGAESNKDGALIKRTAILESEYLHFKCKNCDKTFKTRRLYRQHCKDLHSYVVSCFECQGQCIHEKYLQDIKMQRIKKEKILKCLDCDYHCLRKQSLIGHINKDHLHFFPYDCETCGHTFHSEMALNCHVMASHEEKLKCEYCDMKCIDIGSKIKHKTLCKFRLKKYQCSECKYSFNTKRQLIKHIKFHSTSASLPCSTCLRMFANEKLLEIHVNRVHRQRRCSVCPTIVQSVSDLKVHLRTHEPGEKHKCHTCDKEFDTRKLYNVHVSSYSHLLKADPKAKTKFNFECPHCDFTCKTNYMMENHKNKNHLKLKPYTCPTCNKGFTTGLNLRYHMERHKGIKRYQCSECSNLFTSGAGLKKHVLRYHSDRRPIACDMCDRSFVCQSEYTQHKQRNHSEKNKPCPLCKSKFATPANLRAHLKKVHMKGMNLEEYMKSEEASTQIYELMRDHRVLF